MRVAAQGDWVVDVGPGAGDAGGRIVASGIPAQIVRAEESRTAEYLRLHLVV
jgi:excinuclease ABC subunit A